jgi:hypothetical protein
MIQFIRTIPVELDEAAKIDGCSRLGIFFRIILPLIAPALRDVRQLLVLLEVGGADQSASLLEQAGALPGFSGTKAVFRYGNGV